MMIIHFFKRLESFLSYIYNICYSILLRLFIHFCGPPSCLVWALHTVTSLSFLSSQSTLQCHTAPFWPGEGFLHLSLRLYIPAALNFS